MDGLLPIIRRVRRPLLPVEAPMAAKPPAGSEAGAQAAAIVQPSPAVPPVAPVAPNETQPKRKDKRGKAAASEPAQ